jgi:hypothetical protein
MTFGKAGIRVTGRFLPKVTSLAGLLLTAGLVSACGTDLAGGSGAEPPEGFIEKDGRLVRDTGRLSDLVDGDFGTAGSANDGLAGANRFLWRASLETLSFMPLASTDPFSGVIATDWTATPDLPTERLKVTAFVTDSRLRAEALKVAVYRETRSEDSQWIAAPVDPATARKLEDAILTRARQLRIAEAEGTG